MKFVVLYMILSFIRIRFMHCFIYIYIFIKKKNDIESNAHIEVILGNNQRFKIFYFLFNFFSL